MGSTYHESHSSGKIIRGSPIMISPSLSPSTQLTLLITIILAGAWSSKGVNFTNLDSDDLNQKRAFEFIIVIGVLAILWAIASVVIFLFRQDLPAIVVSWNFKYAVCIMDLKVIIITTVIGLFVVIAVGVFTAGVHSLSQTYEARSLELNLAALEAACVSKYINTKQPT